MAGLNRWGGWRGKCLLNMARYGSPWPLTRATGMPPPLPFPVLLPSSLFRLAKSQFASLAWPYLISSDMRGSDSLFTMKFYSPHFCNPHLFDRLEWWLPLNGNKVQKSRSRHVREGVICVTMGNPSYCSSLRSYNFSCDGGQSTSNFQLMYWSHDRRTQRKQQKHVLKVIR